MVVMFQQLAPQIDIVEPGTSFAGYEMAQTWADLQLYEKVLNDRPDLKYPTSQVRFTQFMTTGATA